MEDFPAPTNVKQLCSFFGYNRRFIPGYARPLHQLTGKDVEFAWTQACDDAFVTLKELLTVAPLLVFPNFELPFKLETDASGDGLGAVLAQETVGKTVQLIAYARS